MTLFAQLTCHVLSRVLMGVEANPHPRALPTPGSARGAVASGGLCSARPATGRSRTRGLCRSLPALRAQVPSDRGDQSNRAARAGRVLENRLEILWTNEQRLSPLSLPRRKLEAALAGPSFPEARAARAGRPPAARWPPPAGDSRARDPSPAAPHRLRGPGAAENLSVS